MAEASKKFNPVRTTAKTEEAAITQALMLVGATRDEAEVEVLDRTEKGVTVRVTPLGSTPRAAASTPLNAFTPIAAPPVDEPPSAPPSAAEAPEFVQAVSDLPDDTDLTNGPDIDEEIAFDSYDEEAEDEDDTEDEDEDESDEDAEPPADESGETIAAAPVEREYRHAAPVDEATRTRARDLAQEVLDKMGLEASAHFVAPMDANAEGAGVSLVVEGADVGILIGKHGATLQGFQYLVNLMLNNGAEGADGARVVVDAGGYRARRAGALEQIARDAAARAKRDRRSVRLEPMPAYERRLVHMALQTDPTVSTSSEGSEPMRHIVISPAGVSPSSGRGDGERRPFEGRSGGRGGFGGFNGRSGPGGGSGGGNRRYGRGGR